MAVSINEIVKVRVSSSETPSLEANQNACCLTSNPLISASEGERLIGFNTLDKVKDYFGEQSEEFIQAEGYFSGYSGVDNIPDMLWFGRLVNEKIAPWIRSGVEVSTVPNATDYVDKTINFFFNNEIIPVKTSAESLVSKDAFINAIQSQLRAYVPESKTEPAFPAATANYDSRSQTIEVSSGLTGKENTVLPCTNKATDTYHEGVIKLADLLGLTVGEAILSQGADDESGTFGNQFEAITYNDEPFVGIWFRDKQSTAKIIEIAKYLESQNDKYVAAFTVNTLAEAESLVQALKEANIAKQVTLSSGDTTYDFNAPICLNESGVNGQKLNAWMYGVMAIGQDFKYPANKMSNILIAQNMTDLIYQKYLSLGVNVYARLKGQNPLGAYRIGRCGDTGNSVGLYGSQNSMDKFYGQNRVRKDLQDTISQRMIVSGENIGADSSTGSTDIKNLITNILGLERTRGWIASGKTWVTLLEREIIRQVANSVGMLNNQEELENALTSAGFWISNGEYISDIETLQYTIVYVSQGAVLTVDINVNPTNY